MSQPANWDARVGNIATGSQKVLEYVGAIMLWRQVSAILRQESYFLAHLSCRLEKYLQTATEKGHQWPSSRVSEEWLKQPSAQMHALTKCKLKCTNEEMGSHDWLERLFHSAVQNNARTWKCNGWRLMNGESVAVATVWSRGLVY